MFINLTRSGDIQICFTFLYESRRYKINILYVFFYNYTMFFCCFFLFQLGYTFVAEVIKPDIPVSDAKWRMRLIGSQEPLPKLSREIPVSAFSVKEFQDYYIPNNKNLLCR